MYDLPETPSESAFEAGTSLLLTGPDAAVRSFASAAVERGAVAGEGVAVVLADEDATLPDLAGAEGPVGVVDCRTERGPTPDGALVRTPARDDLAAVGVAVSELLATFRRTRGVEHNRVLVASTAGLVAAADDEAVFRFLHVLSGRVASADALGLVVHGGDPGDRRAGTLRPVFDGVVTVDPGAGPEFAAVESR